MLSHSFVRTDLWMMIITTAIMITIAKTFCLFKFSKLNIISICGFVWSSFTANFGGKPSGSPIDLKKPYKIIVFISLLGGVVIWIAYRSFLCAELSIVEEKLPFKDLESLSKTTWRYNSLPDNVIFNNFDDNYQIDY